MPVAPIYLVNVSDKHRPSPCGHFVGAFRHTPPSLPHWYPSPPPKYGPTLDYEYEALGCGSWYRNPEASYDSDTACYIYSPYNRASRGVSLLISYM